MSFVDFDFKKTFVLGKDKLSILASAIYTCNSHKGQNYLSSHEMSLDDGICANENLMKIGNYFIEISCFQWLCDTFMSLESNNIQKLIEMYVQRITKETVERLLNYIDSNNILLSYKLIIYFSVVILNFCKNICCSDHFTHLIYYTGFYNIYQPKVEGQINMNNILYGHFITIDGTVLSIF